jgi:hypothetical protein
MKVPLRFIYIGVILVIMALLYSLQLLVDWMDAKSTNNSGSSDNKEGYSNAATAFAINADSGSYKPSSSEPSSGGRGPDTQYDADGISNGNNNVSTDPKKYTYDYANVNAQYHDSIDDINAQSNDPLKFNQIAVIDPSGNKVNIPTLSGQVPVTYYTAGSQIYSPNGYVPNYEDSIYLSRSTGMSTLAEYGPTAQQMGGFCSFYAHDPSTLETKCNSLDVNACASTDCCVLLGGSKCVSGNQRGPTLPANYTDTLVVNKDVYYYRGKCYGHCA